CFGRFAPSNDALMTHVYDLAARCARVVLERCALGKQRAWGMPGARRTRSLVCNGGGSTRVSTTGPPEHPAFPHAMVLTASFVLSPVIGLFCHRRPADMVLSAPGRADLPPLDLTPASRRQDHTTSPSASAPFVSAPCDRSRETRPAIKLRARRCRVHRIPRPTSVTIAKRPSVGRDGEGYSFDLGQARTGIFLQMGLDGANQIDPTGDFFLSRHPGPQ